MFDFSKIVAMEILSEALRIAANRVAHIGSDPAAFEILDSSGLLSAQESISELKGCVDRYAAMAAGEIAQRSRTEFGHSGFAQRAGFLSPEAMLQSLGNISRQEATKLVRIGLFLSETAAAEAAAEAAAAEAEAGADNAGGCFGGDGGDRDGGDRDGGDKAGGGALDRSAGAGGVDGPGLYDEGEAGGGSGGEVPGAGRCVVPPWQAPLAAALTAGVLSIDAVESIRRALGTVDASVTSDALVLACEQLVDSSAGLSPEQLYRRARQLRDSLDEGGIMRREKERRDLRSLRTWWDPAGMYCGTWRLPPEEGSIVATAIDQLMSPRRGGPRFVDPTQRASAHDLVDDARTNEQIAADALVDMIRLAVDADHGTMFGRRRPGVRLIVTEEHVSAQGGHGQIEGHADPVSFETVERYLCDTGAITIGFDTDGQCMNVGRTQRLFTERQRIGMAVRDGGCLFTGCDRPPSYCEAHHIDLWHKELGRTDIADGVLLCRRHHLLLHNNHWQIIRWGADYFLQPPVSVDAEQTLITLHRRRQAHGARGA